MESILQAIEASYAGLAEHQDASGVSFLRYEELLAAPVATIRRLAELLDVKCDARTAETIWASIEGISEASDEGHLRDPRAGKWREFIPPRFAERIRKSRLREYAAAVGYRMDTEDFLGTHVTFPPHEFDLLNMAWQDASWESPTGKRHAIHHPDLYRAHDQDLGLLFVSERSFAEPIEKLRRSPVLRDLVAAAGHEAWDEPPLLADFLNLR